MLHSRPCAPAGGTVRAHLQRCPKSVSTALSHNFLGRVRLTPHRGSSQPLRVPHVLPESVEVQVVDRKPRTGQTEVLDDDERPFLEPAVRSFALGIGAGVLLELVHVFLKFQSFASSAGASLPSVLPSLPPDFWDQLAPLVAWDNLAAILTTLGFYGIEVLAVMAVLAEYPNDAFKAARKLELTKTLPKRLLPFKLQSIKRIVYSLVAARKPALANAFAFRDDTNSPGTAVLDRPHPPPVGAPGGPMPRFPGGDDLLERPGGTSGSGTVLDRPARPAQPTKGATGRGKVAPSVSRRETIETEQEEAEVAGSIPRRAKELRDRRSYLKNFWYAAALSENLQMGKPLEVEMLGRTVVLFRDESDGSVRCLDNLCPHRGAPLAKGWVKEVPVANSISSKTEGAHTCIVCPYHGWAFDGEGKLRDVPSSADPHSLPRRALVDSYPVEEKGGFVWLFFGSSSLPADERPPIPFVPELEDPLWQPVYGEIAFDAPHWSVFDNAIDMAHIHYLHGDSFGNSDKPVIQEMSSQRDTFMCSGKFKIHNKPVSALWDWTAVDSVPVEFQAHLPSTSSIKITLGMGVQMITFVNTVPIDGNRAINRFCLIRNFAGWPGFDKWARNAMFKILGEDKVMVELLKPEGVRYEVSLEADAPQLAFRKLRQEWVDIGGYTINPEMTQGHNGSLRT